MADGLKLGVLASGRGTDLQSLLDASGEGRIRSRVVVVVSDDPQAKALERARRNGIAAVPLPVSEGLSADARRKEHEERMAKVLAEHGVDLVVLAGYMRILSPYLLRKYPQKVINIHPALLPSFRGTHGQQQAVEWGVRVSGCTVHFVDEDVDHGPVLLQAALALDAKETEETLSRRILAVEHQLLPRAVYLIEQGRATVEGRRVRLDPDESWTHRYPALPGVLYGYGY